MKTSILYTVLLTTLVLRVRAQETNLSLTMADKAYESQEYSLASRLYEKVEHYHSFHLYKLPAYIPSRLATCYLVLNDYADAARWFKVITDQTPVRPEDWIGYGDVLKSLGRYQEAKTAYRHAPDSLYNRVQNRVDGCDSALAWMAAPTNYAVSNLAAVNTAGSDWGAVSYGGSLVFTSDSGRTAPAPTSFLSVLKGAPTGGPYQKVYVLDSGSVSGFSPVLNNELYHDGAVTFNRTGDTAWYSVTHAGSLKEPGEKLQYKEGNRTVTIRIRRLELWWTARDSSGHWTPAHAFAYNNPAKYSVGQPALDNTGGILYFASDMPGGYGKSDIWYCLRQPDGSWGAPVNCGPDINTADEEAFPYIGPDGTLYFASKGHVGMGGFDVYKATGTMMDWIRVTNLKYPLNSSGDDFYFSMRDSVSGYVSSDRPGGKGSDDIYAFSVKPPAPPTPPIAAKPITPDTARTVASATPGAGNPGAGAPGTPGVSTSGSGVPGGATPDSSAPSAPRPIILATRVFDKLSGEPLAGAQVLVTGDTHPSVTNAKGMTYKVLAPETRFIDSATKTGYAADGGVVSTEGHHPDTLSLSLYLLKAPEKGDVFVLHNVYFDFDKAYIRADAAVELDRVVAYMKQYPGVTIDLSSHTDSRGNDAYNMALSIRRARSARWYLNKHGISYKRVTTHGYGETRLTNGCSNDVPCTEEQHQANRRVEIKVLKS